MAMILQIDTATEHASISISIEGKLIADKENDIQKDHAAFVQPAIKKLCEELDISIRNFDAISVVAGPGSYTGLRVGMASAKGLCFGLNIPLIMINTLEAMALSSIIRTKQTGDFAPEDQVLFCPMIDARRSEVFAAVYDEKLNIVLPPSAIIVDENSFRSILDRQVVVFSGNGSLKFRKMFKHQNNYFDQYATETPAISVLSDAAFRRESFTDLAYAEPGYLKSFYTLPSKQNK